MVVKGTVIKQKGQPSFCKNSSFIFALWTLNSSSKSRRGNSLVDVLSSPPPSTQKRQFYQLETTKYMNEKVYQHTCGSVSLFGRHVYLTSESKRGFHKILLFDIISHSTLFQNYLWMKDLRNTNWKHAKLHSQKTIDVFAWHQFWPSKVDISFFCIKGQRIVIINYK